MSRVVRTNGSNGRHGATAKYDAHHVVLDKTYGALADLRRELSDSKATVAERTDLLHSFATCEDSQRAWLLLEDYFERLSLARKDFAGDKWWPRLLASRGNDRLEATALLFVRSNRSLPTELARYANLERFAQIEQAEREEELVQSIEYWLLPPVPLHLDSPRAALRVFCELQPAEAAPGLFALKAQFALCRPRTGQKVRSLAEVLDLTTRSGHERELFPAADWEFIQWLEETYPDREGNEDHLLLSGIELLQWLARWGHTARFESPVHGRPLRFHGQCAELVPNLEAIEGELSLTHHLALPDGSKLSPAQVRFLAGDPKLFLADSTFYLVRNPPPPSLIAEWVAKPYFPVRQLSHRLLAHLRKNAPVNGADWEQLCVIHRGIPQFVFELSEETVRLRLLAQSETDQSDWQWNGHEWQTSKSAKRRGSKPEILDDPRLDAATTWLRKLDWFTPELGLWVGDANDVFLNTLAEIWPDRPAEAEYLGNPAFHRLFLSPRLIRPKFKVTGSGIDWFSVCAAWEAEGLKLTESDLQRLQAATGRFVKLPDSGWIELDVNSVRAAHETIADLGLEGLSPLPQRVSMDQASRLDEPSINRLLDPAHAKALRSRLANFEGIAPVEIPATVRADLRPYQKEGFAFLCHLTHLGLGGILADDMGLGKTLQTLTWLAWLRKSDPKQRRPALVICPASVLHNWRREANRFAPDLKVLLLESGAARHNLRKQIPEHDLIVTNYALLRRDLAALQKFAFHCIILDEAQFIKNPTAQVTQSVKQLKSGQRIALTGTPLENRLLDLWSIVDFVQPGYLGNQEHFSQNYEPKGEDAAWSQKIARRRLSGKIRPLMLRRLKSQVAKDLPDRIEERRDCDLGEEQRKLYLAELRRSRERIQQAIEQQGLAKSKIHVLAALTRLRQICCHPKLVGNDSASGKTETLFELLEPLISEGQKVLVFSQFVQMLRLLETECKQRQYPTYLLTGETKERHEVVNAFQSDPNAAIFLLSLRAAGTGLNLTNASYVVLYDPWWNPAVEAQAIDRSHRIGQSRTVIAYRLISPNTVEDKIWELQQRKAEAIADVLGEQGFARSLTKSDLEYLFSED